MLKLVLFYLIAHILSFICSIFEAVLLSCNNSYIALLRKKGSKSAAYLEELKTHIDRPLSAILTLNTVSHTIGAAGVGASIVELFGDKALAIGSIILTLTMLYWTEMLPKTLGVLYWKTLAPLFARPIKWLIYITYPFVISFNFFARFISKKKGPDKITDEDIQVALEAGAKAGVIEEEERDMVENIFRLGDRRVGVLMVPRVDIEWLDVNDPIESIKQKILASPHNLFPLADRDVDNVIGVLSRRDVIEKTEVRAMAELRRIARPPLFIHEQSPVFELMDLFKKHRGKFAFVADEYGTIKGMITMSDIFNAIVRNIEEGEKGSGDQIVKVSNRAFLLDGRMPIDEFKEIFHLEILPLEEKCHYRTLSGLCMTILGAVPKRGEFFNIESLRIEILKVRRRRVEKVLVTRQEVPLR